MEVIGLIVVEDEPRSLDAAAPQREVWALEHVANRPIASHVLDALVTAGIKDLMVLSSDGLDDQSLDCLTGGRMAGDVRVRQVRVPDPLDLASALAFVAPVVGSSRCVVHSASGLLEAPLAPFLERVHGLAPDAIGFVHHNAVVDGRLSAATQEMLQLAELDPQRSPLGVAGVWLFGPGAIEHVAGTRWRSGGEVDLTGVAERIKGVGGTLELLPVDAWRSYAGRSDDLLDLNRIVLDRLPGELRRPDGNGNRIEGRVNIDERARVHDSVVLGPTVIGPGAEVADAYIGPYTSIGAGARVHGAEIECSIVGSAASILHVGARIVSSVIGRDARVVRDFSLPRALRLRIGAGTEVALS